MEGLGRLRRGRSLRSAARPELGAAPPQKEAEFPALCSGGTRLLTPRNPEKNAAGSGGSQFLAPGSDWFLLYPGAGGFLPANRGGRTANGEKKRHKAGVSHQLPAWPGTTITSSSCSSSGTAVRPRRGCQREVGPSPVLIVLFCCWRIAAPSQRPRLFLGCFSHGTPGCVFPRLKRGSVHRPPPPCFCGADRAEVVCPGWVC